VRIILIMSTPAPGAVASPLLAPQVARSWVASWERAQDLAVAARQRRSAAVVELVDREVARAATRCAVPVVLELGAGTGSLARRTAQRTPGARVVALEDDPVLLALARATCAGSPGVEVVGGSPEGAGWLEALGHVDVVVASGVLHRLRPSALAVLYRELAAALPARGVLVVADEMSTSTRPDNEQDPGTGTGAGAGADGEPAEPADPASAWWQDVARVPELARAVLARGGAVPPRRRDDLLSAPEHRRVLADLGFSRTEEVWRSGPSAVLAAWR